MMRKELFPKILIGSNTVNAIANTEVPVLVIPELTRFENFLNKRRNRIVLASDLDKLENEGALGILKETLLFQSIKKEMTSNTHLPMLVFPDAKI